MTKETQPPPTDVTAALEQDNKSDLKISKTVAKRAGEIAKATSTYDAQRKGKPDWLKPPKS
ncbi:hypothetical protein GWE18_38370 [Bradyrhizobium sp. CSA112]|uniref:hypothetical protein n=1 Tax=Bradyrhizobium sp. CSA112 TaxID=2699170 RepID=UPI0023AE8E2B|nr:hypothetical protein [Bradyrhizobium sp. CSA112]MDE5458544.1 hypothetical protein [Bradyrhizobium sp. CSA112]